MVFHKRFYKKSSRRAIFFKVTDGVIGYDGTIELRCYEFLWAFRYLCPLPKQYRDEGHIVFYPSGVEDERWLIATLLKKLNSTMNIAKAEYRPENFPDVVVASNPNRKPVIQFDIYSSR